MSIVGMRVRVCIFIVFFVIVDDACSTYMCMYEHEWMKKTKSDMKFIVK